PHGNVAIFVDRGADHRAAIFAKPRRVIGSAAKQRNAEGGAADDHAFRFIDCAGAPSEAPKTSSARASDSGVPMSINLKHSVNAARERRGNCSKTSRSSDPAVPAAITSSSCAETK